MDTPATLESPDAPAHASAPPPSRLRLAVPSLVTLGNATCGFVAIVLLIAQASHGPLTAQALAPAALVILAGWIFDMGDGMVARLLKATSGFGVQLDSLCDAVTFGFAPAVLVAAAGGLGWGARLAGLIYLWAVLIRLARFNDEAADGDSHMYFRGLPSPAAAAIVAGCVATAAHPVGAIAWFGPLPAAVGAGLLAALPWLAVAAAALMVTTLRYADGPKHYARGWLPRWHLGVFAALMALVGPAAFLFGYFTLYAAWGAFSRGGSRA